MREYLIKVFGTALQYKIVHTVAVEEKFPSSEPNDKGYFHSSNEKYNNNWERGSKDGEIGQIESFQYELMISSENERVKLASRNLPYRREKDNKFNFEVPMEYTGYIHLVERHIQQDLT